MANLLEIVQSVYDQVGNDSDEAPVTREAMLVDAKAEYAFQMQLVYWAEKQREGFFEIPSHLLSEAELPVVDNEIDISSINVFNAFSTDSFIQNIGGLTCECQYIKSSVNRRQMLCGFESIDDSVKPYVPLGKKIKFPEGTHAKTLKIIYINKGEQVDDNYEIDDKVASLVRDKLQNIYLGKITQKDQTNNTNPNT